MITKNFIDRTLLALMLIASCILFSLYLFYRWDIGFHSDSVLTGLVAKSILDRGEHPIFIWDIGYQGMLLEAHLAALLFKLFGIGPIQLFATAAILFVPMLFCFYYVTKIFYNKQIALISSLFLIVSSPWFYNSVFRTQPNYTETFLFGLLLILLYFSLVKRHYIQGEPLCKKSYLYVFLFAFVLGFGIYTYQQILYFFLAVLCHFLIILLRLGIKNTPKFSIFQTLFPVFVLRKKSYKIILSAFYLFAGVGLLFSFYEFFSNSKSVLHGIVGPAREVVLFAALLILISMMIYLVHYLKQIKSYFLLIFTFISGLMFGISPLLYYYIIQHKAPRMHITARGSWTGFVDRFFILARGNMWFLNLDLTKFSDQILVLVLFFIFLSFFIISLFGFYRIIFKNKNKATLLEHSPIVFLVPVVILGFSLSGRVMDLMGARYSLVLWFFYATGLGWFLVTFWNRYKYSGVRTLLVCLFVWILMQNSSAFYKDLTQPRRDIAYRQVITSLEKNQIRFGYSEYWTSYAVNFLSLESIILDTITPGYNPHYAEPVKNAFKIAYVLPKNNETSVPFQREIHIINNTYTVKGRADTERYYIILLEKKT